MAIGEPSTLSATSLFRFDDAAEESTQVSATGEKVRVCVAASVRPATNIASSMASADAARRHGGCERHGWRALVRVTVTMEVPRAASGMPVRTPVQRAFLAAAAVHDHEPDANARLRPFWRPPF